MSNAAEARSTFVTVVAWIFIVLSGFSLLISAMQNVMVWTMFHPREMRAEAGPPTTAFEWIGLYPEVLVGGFFVCVLLTFIASIGVLKRKRWARAIFVAILALIIASQVAGFALQLDFFSGGSPFSDERGFMVFFLAFTAAFAFALCALLAWIIKRLLTEPIASEFS